VHAFYVQRAAAGGALGAKTGAVTVVQRTSSDLRGRGDQILLTAAMRSSSRWRSR
jgi:hypothetical protein